MSADLHRYWMEFSAPPNAAFRIGAGVTAWTEDDAIGLVARACGCGPDRLELSKLVADVDMLSLDQKHVLPNAAVPSMRGIWFPQGYQEATR